MMWRLLQWLLALPTFRARVVCSRCREKVADARPPEHGFTIGYYILEGYWSQFANIGEEILCDRCMWADDRYIKIYGHVTPCS